MINIVLLGCPGAGKGTLAKQLEETFKMHVVTPGELYRKEAELGTDFGLRAKAYWADGNLCPDEMTNELMRKTIETGTTYIGRIFDGYPRTVVQAEYLDSITQIDLVFDISISDDIAVKRLLRRATIENRPDDTEEIIQQRLNVYHTNNDSIVQYYSGDKRYNKIYGEGTPKDTMDLVVQILVERATNKVKGIK
jgi:adenylate kinase